LKTGNAIAIDGPAASGKTAVGSELARRLGFRFLDTGGMYRAVTLLALEAGIDARDEAALTELSRRSAIDPVGGPSGDRLTVDGRDVTDELRARNVDLRVSQVSAVKGVRVALVEQQRIIAGQGPIVMVGRDIGTVVLPDAKGKVYLNASAEVRARRRVRDMTDLGRDASYDRVVNELKARDDIDSKRRESPLRPAEGALIIDTDDMSVEQIAETVLRRFRPEQWS
jgi:cytidylate kinase